MLDLVRFVDDVMPDLTAQDANVLRAVAEYQLIDTKVSRKDAKWATYTQTLTA